MRKTFARINKRGKNVLSYVRLPGHVELEEGACVQARVPAQAFLMLLLCRMHPNLRTRENNNDSFIEASVV